MSSRGRQIAGLVAIAVVLLLPKRVECGFPGGECRHGGPLHLVCTDVEVEPLGFYVVELIAKRDVGFAYSTDEDCH